MTTEKKIIRRVKMKQSGLLRADTSLPNGLTPGKEVTNTWNGTTCFQLEHGFTRVEHDGNGIGDAC